VREYADLKTGIVVGIATMPSTNLSIRNADIQPLYELYKPSVDWAADTFGPHARGIVKRPVICAFARAHLFGVNLHELERVAREYIDQTWGEGSPMRLLSLYLSTRMGASSGATGSVDLYLRSARAINAAVHGKVLGQLKVTEDPFPCDLPF
jgi:hypothetical protein